MLLETHLKGLTREDLQSYARDFKLKQYSKLRKDTLIKQLIKCFCAEERLRKRLTYLTEEQMNLFHNAMDHPLELTEDTIADAMELFLCNVGFINVSDMSECKFYVFYEVAEAFRKIDDEAFRKEQNKKQWLRKCLQFYKDYYGIAPVEIIYKLYTIKIDDTIEGMMDILNEMPSMIKHFVVMSMNTLALKDRSEEDPLYSSMGLLIQISLLKDDEYRYLLDMQKDKEFYIPSEQQIEEICRMGYEASTAAYKELETFFMENLDMSYEQAVIWCHKAWESNYEFREPKVLINEMVETGIPFTGESQKWELVRFLGEAHNNTRMKENRGYKPNEMESRDFMVEMEMP